MHNIQFSLLNFGYLFQICVKIGFLRRFGAKYGHFPFLRHRQYKQMRNDRFNEMRDLNVYLQLIVFDRNVLKCNKGRRCFFPIWSFDNDLGTLNPRVRQRHSYLLLYLPHALSWSRAIRRGSSSWGVGQQGLWTLACGNVILTFHYFCRTPCPDRRRSGGVHRRDELGKHKGETRYVSPLCLVGQQGLEPRTDRLWAGSSNQLSYWPALCGAVLRRLKYFTTFVSFCQ